MKRIQNKRDEAIKALDTLQFGTITIVKQNGQISFVDVKLGMEEYLNLVDKIPEKSII